MKNQKDEEKYKEYLRKLDLNDKEVGEMLGYSSRQSWNGAHRRPVILKGLIRLFAQCERIFTKNNDADN